MARGEYFVSQEADRWKVQHNGLGITFATPRAALTAALSAAHQAGERGFGGRVLVQQSDGKWKTQWVHGRDPLPEVAAAA